MAMALVVAAVVVAVVVAMGLVVAVVVAVVVVSETFLVRPGFVFRVTECENLRQIEDDFDNKKL